MRGISRKTAMQFVKYNVGGLAYFWSAWLIITFLTDTLGFLFAYLLGNFVGLSLNYLVQRYWAFDGSGRTLLNSGWRFAVLTIANLGIGYVMLRLLVSTGIPLWFAQFIVAGFFTVWNWIWYKWWVFTARDKAQE